MSNEVISYGCGGDQKSKKKRCHPHTPYQIRELEAFFKEFQHPDGLQKKELSQQLGMHMSQIRYWFQNKRTRTKAQRERGENSQLRIENEKLRIENMSYNEALRHRYCRLCELTPLGDISVEERHLSMENARLREEVKYLADMVGHYVGKPMVFTNSNEASSSCVSLPSQPPSTTS